MATFYLLRHGEVPSNIEGRHLGRRDYSERLQRDELLTQHGRNQARLVGRILAHEYPQVDLMFASPLKRAQETAVIIENELRAVTGKGDYQVITDPRLNELDMGAFDDLLEDEAESLYPNEYHARQHDKWSTPSLGGESYRMAVQRADGFLEDVLQDHPQDSIAIVGHQGIIRALIISLMKDNVKRDKVLDISVPQESFYKVTYDVNQPEDARYVLTVCDPHDSLRS